MSRTAISLQESRARQVGRHCILAALLGAVTLSACAAPPHNVSIVSPAPAARVDISDEMVRQLPATFFGFNLEYFSFQTELFDPKKNQVKPEAVAYFSQLPGSVYRYPGGLISNRFNWEWAVGPVAQRKPQRAVGWHKPVSALFGPIEYLEFAEAVAGQPWYTVNLLGWSQDEMVKELPSKTLAASNQKLARLLVAKAADTGGHRYYQLGNELDRSVYEWSPKKYVERSRDTIEAISSVDPQARFVAFLRDFNWTYKTRGGRSTYKDFMREVLTELPMVQDYSFQYYYDYPAEDRDTVSEVPERLAMFQEAISYATKLRNGQAPRVWVTEYGRSRHPGIKGDRAYRFTNGIGGALSQADFLIAITQIPEIQGAYLHIGGQWSLFDHASGALQPMPTYWALRVLRETSLPDVLSTHSASPNISGYAGGYDMRAVAFASVDRKEYGMWMVNRSVEPTTVSVKLGEWAGAKLKVRHFYLSGRGGIKADQDYQPPSIVLNPPEQGMKADAQGRLQLRLPANSVSGFRFVRL